MRAVSPFSSSPVHRALAIASDFCSLAAVAKWCHAQNVRSAPPFFFRFSFFYLSPSHYLSLLPGAPGTHSDVVLPLHIESAPQREGVAGLGSSALMVVSFHSFIYVSHQHTRTYTHTRIHTLGLFLFLAARSFHFCCLFSKQSATNRFIPSRHA